MVLSSPLLYLCTVCIWGTTFYAIHFQLGEVSPVVSVMWRFLLASIVLFVWIKAKKLPCVFSRRQHGWIALQGILLFSINYVLVYTATEDLTSGLVAVIFAGMVAMNILNSAIFLNKPIAAPVVLGAILGTSGLILVFWPEVRDASASSAVLPAIGLALISTYCASLGNVISARNQSDHLPVLQSNAFGMLYGALASYLYMLLAGIPLDFSLQPSYLFSLLYLSIFGSVLAFGAYMSLIGQIGADRAAYAMVMFPLVALGISTVFEGYNWQTEAIFGVILVLLGNILVLNKGLSQRIQSLLTRQENLSKPS